MFLLVLAASLAGFTATAANPLNLLPAPKGRTEMGQSDSQCSVSKEEGRRCYCDEPRVFLASERLPRSFTFR